jgi:hypothetical protein
MTLLIFLISSTIHTILVKNTTPPTPIAIYIQEGMQFVSLYFDTTDIIFWFGKLMHSEILAIFSLFKTSFCKNIMKNI